MKMASVVGLMIAAGLSASGAMQESPKFFQLGFCGEGSGCWQNHQLSSVFCPRGCRRGKWGVHSNGK